MPVLTETSGDDARLMCRRLKVSICGRSSRLRSLRINADHDTHEFRVLGDARLFEDRARPQSAWRIADDQPFDLLRAESRPGVACDNAVEKRRRQIAPVIVG